jgi:UDP-N-acetylglucosamine/UDP-N-acetylgalactosamine diphosphorylase
MHLDRLRAIARRFATRIPLYIMTSPATHAETVQFFAGHERFGLGADELRIFCQGTMPALDAQTGQLLLADRGALFLSPDGHGGALAALDASGCLADARQRGIDQLFYLQVDNPLVAICDPVFVGYHLLAESEMSSQVVAKQDPREKVGNLVTIDGQMRVIEYSDLPADVARQRNADGSLRLWAGSIAVHVLDAAFLERAAQSHASLPFHRALKTVPFVDAAGQLQHPAQPNAIKFERFIFDLLPWARHPLAFEVAEQEAFAPLKNAAPADKDTAEHVRAAIVRQHAGWLRAAGVLLEAGVPVEIHPLFAEGPEELRGRLRSPLRIAEPTYFRPRE